ncbi:hydroxyisourate hydrolase [Methylobacterium oryzihabitans]|uniref:hydroxyisourate hydrolase n=1 Tax=Methylobacterium oryzihabitans TaxID=2499852 RepID=A0A437NVL7_9HYPH|nr:hydroxyisourate hydrolase [Methylobacterium oryzihabitans]RVU13969.1 hydroxyisourate hydrolase [Methylobacterium oryzihabitans]
MSVTLDALNAADRAAFVTALAGLLAPLPEAAIDAAAAQRPFASVTTLHEALMRAAAADAPAVFGVLPDLSASDLRDASAGESGPTPEQAATLARGVAAHRARFGLPFVLCATRHDPASALARLTARLADDPAAAQAAALAELGHLLRQRLAASVDGPGLPGVNGRLSTHVLDTHGGRPAAGVALRLYALGAGRRLVTATTTNRDGRTDAPLLSGAPLRAGRYEIEFDLGPYFRDRVPETVGNLFLETVPLRFGIDEPEGHYHVALIATPWSYTCYRGS